MMSSLLNAMSLVAALQGVTAEQSIQRHQNLVEQAQDCSAMTSDKQRLNCFDGVFKRNLSEAQKQAKPAKENSPVPITKPPSLQLQAIESRSAVEKFGGEHLEVAKETVPKLEVVTFTVDKVELTIRKQQRFFFTNGQIWENKTSKELRVGKGDQVLVKDGALSAFYLSKVGGAHSVRVKRVK